jgi:hypothetical protein
MQTTESNPEGGAVMSTPDNRRARQEEGERRKDAAHLRLEALRDVYIRRARRALLSKLLESDTATADDVAERIGPTDASIDPRWLGTVPGLLAIAKIIRRVGYTKSARPSRNASVIGVWELADRAAALAWLARHPDLPDAEPDDGGTLCPSTPKPSSPMPLAASLSQPKLF